VQKGASDICFVARGRKILSVRRILLLKYPLRALLVFCHSASLVT
jgi:hypothetical protein